MFYENVIPSDACNSLIATFNEENYEPALVNTETNQKLNKKVRDTDRQWALKDDFISCVLTHFIMKANQEALWNFDITEPETVQIARYRENQFYEQHIDCNVMGGEIIATGNGGAIVVPMLAQRKISASLLLSDESDYEGGDLVIINEVAKTKKQGSIIVFPSFLAHQVTPVTQGVRYSAVCWMNGPKWK
jgi:PKHD-type hydroxylase